MISFNSILIDVDDIHHNWYKGFAVKPAYGVGTTTRVFFDGWLWWYRWDWKKYFNLLSKLVADSRVLVLTIDNSIHMRRISDVRCHTRSMKFRMGKVTDDQSHINV